MIAPAFPDLGAPNSVQPSPTKTGTRVTSRKVNNEGTVSHFPPNSREIAAAFRCPDENRKKVSSLLFAAFPASSAHAVSQRASLVLGRDARTIRSWMEGRTKPNWDEMAIIAGYAGFERAMKIIWGR